MAFHACRQLIYCLLKLLAWVPVVFVVILLLWGYYVYVYIINLSGIGSYLWFGSSYGVQWFYSTQGSFSGISDSPAVSVFMVVMFLALAHVIFFLQVVSYTRTIITHHKQVPQQFYLTEDQLEELDRAVSLSQTVATTTY